MDRDINCTITRSLIDFVEEQVGDSSELLKDLHPELGGVTETRGFLTDDHNWVSSDLMKELFQRAKALTTDDGVALKAGFEAINKKRLGYIQELFLRTMTTPVMGLKRAQVINEKFNRTKSVELTNLCRNGAVIRLHWFNGMELTRDFCLINQGIYKAIATAWGLPPAELVEKECYFHGGRYCEYHLKWKPGSRRLFIKTILSKLLPSQRFFSHAMDELGKERDLLEQKFAESHSLTINLKEKIERLAAIQEATRVVVSMTNLEEVLNEVMTLMVKVTGFERAVLMLKDEDQDVLRFGQGVGADQKTLSRFQSYMVTLDKTDNILVQVAVTGKPLFIENVRSSQINLNNPIIKQFNPLSFFVVPVAVREKVIGVLAADKGSTGANITEDDREYLTAFVNQIGGAIASSRLMENNHQRYLSSVQSLATALEARDTYTGGHSERVTNYSVDLGVILKLSTTNLDLLRNIVPLHDIGKIGVPDRLLRKKTPLEESELEAIREHALVGEQIVGPLNLHGDGLAIVRNHHERFDGRGYPDRLAGEEIPIVVRIVSVTDAFDAMTTLRPYRENMSVKKTLMLLESNAGTQFDPHVTQAFVDAVKSRAIKLPADIFRSGSL